MKIAILIPAFNAEKTLLETLISVKKNIDNNTNDDISVYLADDCSTDGTVALVENFIVQKKMPIIVLKGERNLGEWNNVNRCMEIITKKYDWFLIIHADDIAKADWLQTMLTGIKNSTENCVSISSSYDVLFPNGKIEEGENNLTNSIIEGNKSSIKDTLIKGTWWHVSGCAIKSSFIKEHGVFSGNMKQYCDMEFLIRILFNKKSVLYISKSLTTYRQINTSVSSNSFKTNLDILEFSSLVAHFNSYFSKKEMSQHNQKFQGFLNKRIIKSIATLSFKRLISALKLKVYVSKVLFKHQTNKFQFPFLEIITD